MKNYIYLAVFAILSIANTSCDSSSNSDKARIAQLEEQIRELQSSSYSSSSSSSSRRSSFEPSAKTNASDFVGTYKVTDEAGVIWTIVLNADETVTFETEGGSKYYGSWDIFPYKFPCMSFGWDEWPYLYFPSGREDVYHGCIKDGYFYSSNTAASAKNPNKRLPIKKIK